MGGWGLCAVGGSTTMLSYCQYPAMREGLVGGPCLHDNIERFVEPRVGLLHRHAKTGKLIVAIALADAEIEPSSG